MFVALILMGILFLIAVVGVIILVLTTPGRGTGTRHRPATDGLTLQDKNKLKGDEGEAIVTQLLRTGLPATEYEVFTKLVIKAGDGSARVEMDQVVLSRFGIVVVETKKWPGEVYGSEDGEWTQILGSRVTHQHSNPYEQNAWQVRRLRKHLGISASAVRGFVCFARGTILPYVVPPNVVVAEELLDAITGDRTEVLNDEGVAQLRHSLQALVEEGAREP